MKVNNETGSTLLRRATTALLLSGAALLTGCATHYVDTATREIPAAQYVKVAQPQPVRVNFAFQSDGAINPAATEMLRGQVTDQIAASGLFSSLVTAPDAGILNITVNNLSEGRSEAAGKGFVTGLTFGLAGSTVVDYYVCRISYLPRGKSKPVAVTSRHAIRSTIGASSAPPNAIKAQNLDEAIRTMTRQIVSTALNNLSQTAALD